MTRQLRALRAWAFCRRHHITRPDPSDPDRRRWE